MQLTDRMVPNVERTKSLPQFNGRLVKVEKTDYSNGSLRFDTRVINNLGQTRGIPFLGRFELNFGLEGLIGRDVWISSVIKKENGYVNLWQHIGYPGTDGSYDLWQHIRYSLELSQYKVTGRVMNSLNGHTSNWPYSFSFDG